MNTQNNKPSGSPKGFLRWVPILAALFSCAIVSVLGVLLTPADTYANNANASPGKAIGGAALVVSVIVLFAVKALIDRKKD